VLKIPKVIKGILSVLYIHQPGTKIIFVWDVMGILWRCFPRILCFHGKNNPIRLKSQNKIFDIKNYVL